MTLAFSLPYDVVFSIDFHQYLFFLIRCMITLNRTIHLNLFFRCTVVWKNCQNFLLNKTRCLNWNEAIQNSKVSKGSQIFTLSLGDYLDMIFVSEPKFKSKAPTYHQDWVNSQFSRIWNRGMKFKHYPLCLKLQGTLVTIFVSKSESS